MTDHGHGPAAEAGARDIVSVLLEIVSDFRAIEALHILRKPVISIERRLTAAGANAAEFHREYDGDQAITFGSAAGLRLILDPEQPAVLTSRREALIVFPMAGQESELQGVKPVRRWFYHLMLLLLRRPIQHLFKLQPVNVDIIPRSGGAILVANHVTLLDPIWIYDVLKRPVYFVATEELFRGRLLGRLLRWFGAFPKRKAALDLKTTKNMIKILLKGGLLGLYPEGVRTWDGTNAPIIPTIARIIRRVKVPVYTCRVEGGYLSFPRWADKWRRIPVRMVFNRLYNRSTIPESDQQILKDIAREIEIRDYGLPIDDPRHRFTGLAAGLYKVLYRCPNCRTLEGLAAVRPLSSNQIECRSCFSTWTVDIRSWVTPMDEHGTAVGESQTVAELYRRIKEMPLSPIQTNLIRLEEGEKAYLVSRPQFLFRERNFPRMRLFAFGRALLTERRLLFKGRASLRLAAPLEQIESLSIEPGDKLHFIYRGALYRIPFRRESPLKWTDAVERLRAELGPSQGTFLAGGMDSG